MSSERAYVTSLAQGAAKVPTSRTTSTVCYSQGRSALDYALLLTPSAGYGVVNKEERRVLRFPLSCGSSTHHASSSPLPRRQAEGPS
eukprot:5274502-Pyramimonas_sp.AAC.2